MRKIWKYYINARRLYENDETAIEMPKYSKIVDVKGGPLEGDIYMWAVVNTEEEKRVRRFRVVRTGHDVPWDRCRKYIGTAHTPNFVWHVWEGY